MYFFVASTYAQTPEKFIGINTTNPKALLDVSNTPGFQIPRVTRAQRLSLIDPSHGTLVFDTTVGCMASWNAKYNGSGGWLFLCGDSIESFLSCKDIDVFLGNDGITITPEMLVDQLDYGLVSEGLEIKLKDNTNWTDDLSVGCNDLQQSINYIDLKSTLYFRTKKIKENSVNNDEFFPMRRYNTKNTTIINPENSNKTAVKGQPWMNAIQFLKNNNNNSKHILWAQRRAGSNVYERIEMYIENNKLNFFYGKEGGDNNQYLKWQSNTQINFNEWKTVVTIYDGGETGGNSDSLLDYYSRFKFYNISQTNQLQEISGTWDHEGNGYNENIGGLLWIGQSGDDNSIIADLKFSKFILNTLNIDSSLPNETEILMFAQSPAEYETTYLSEKKRRRPHFDDKNNHTYNSNKNQDIKVFQYYLAAGPNNTTSLRNQVYYSENDFNKRTWLYSFLESNIVSETTSITLNNLDASIRFKNDSNISCEATINILESITPTLTYNNNGNANTTAEQSNGGTISPIISPLGGEFTSTPGLDIDANTGIINVCNSTPGTYQVTYQSSCDKSVSHEVIINDQAITITCPDTINAETAGNSANINITNPTHNGIDINGIRSDNKDLNNPYPIGTTTITWTAINSCGESASCSQDVVVEKGCGVQTDRQYSYNFNGTYYLEGLNINNAHFGKTNAKWTMNIIFKSTSSNNKQTLWSLGNQPTEGRFILYYQGGKVIFEMYQSRSRNNTNLIKFELGANLINSGDWNSIVINYDGNKNGSSSFSFYKINLSDKSIINIPLSSLNITQIGSYNNIRPSNAFNVGRDVYRSRYYLTGNIASLSFSNLVNVSSTKDIVKFALNPKCWLYETSGTNRFNTNIYLMGDHNSGSTNSIINQSDPSSQEFRLKGTAKKINHGNDIY